MHLQVKYTQAQEPPWVRFDSDSFWFNTEILVNQLKPAVQHAPEAVSDAGLRSDDASQAEKQRSKISSSVCWTQTSECGCGL